MFFGSQNISLVVSLQFSVCSNKANVPADLQSAGIKYKDFSIRLLPIFLINRYESRIADPYI